MVFPIILILVIPSQKHYPFKMEGDSCIIPFTTDDNGYIYISARFNDTTGIFFVDTGSDISGIKESLLNRRDTTFRLKLSDAQKIQDRKKMIRAKNFDLGEVEFPHIKVWPLDNESWLDKGFFNNKQNLVGVIGSDILSHFICEFDMEKYRIVLHKPKKNHSILSDSTSIPLRRYGKGYTLEIQIDSLTQMVKFDSGCSTPLVLKDTISSDFENFKIFGGTQKTFFNHLKNDSSNSGSFNFCIAKNINLANDTIKSAICVEKADANLFGVPFFWSYKKVIADYPNQKISFIEQRNELKRFDVGTHLVNFQINAILLKRKLAKLTIDSSFPYYPNPAEKNNHELNYRVPVNVSVQYNIYGYSRWYGNSLNELDSIVCLDSVLLPNREMVYGKYKIETN